MANFKKYLENNVLEDPRRHGKALVGNPCGQWLYRIGNYRVIVHIVDDELIVSTLEIGHRRDNS